ncbi:MAG: hypothetical protein KJ064_04490 [Anaerolineae bacterium]|nr:hypothetical protein [Anaerolineae bacterium]
MSDNCRSELVRFCVLAGLASAFTWWFPLLGLPLGIIGLALGAIRWDNLLCRSRIAYGIVLSVAGVILSVIMLLLNIFFGVRIE